MLYGSLLGNMAGSGVFNYTHNEVKSFALGMYTTVFQAEIYAITRCALDLDKIVDTDITICSDSQAALRAISNVSTTSKNVLECKTVLSKLGVNNRVTLYWVPAHNGILGNEKADELAKNGSSASFIGPEPYFGISPCRARALFEAWAKEEHEKRWHGINTSCKHTKTLFPTTKTGLTKEILQLGRNNVRLLVSVLTGHNILNKHMHTIGINANPMCRCGLEEETGIHFLCVCPLYFSSRLMKLGATSLDPNELNQVKLPRLLDFIHGTKRFDQPED